MIIKPLKPLKASEKIKIAYANGCRTVYDYAWYNKKNTIPSYINKAINEQIKNI